jgi:phenylacetate-CoA ligase
MGYPSSLAALAREPLRGALGGRPKWIQCSGEPVTKGDRDLIQSAFGVGLTNVYSCTEHMMLGIARPEFDGMYLLEDDLIFEIKDGYTLVTNLFNYTTPLIRYRIDDALEKKADATGLLPFTKVEEIVERAELTATLTNRHGVDDILHASQVADIFDDNVSGFQLRVVDKTCCVVAVCLRPQPDGAAQKSALRDAENQVAALFARKEMGNVRVSVQELAELPRDPRSGKMKFVVHAPPVPV